MTLSELLQQPTFASVEQRTLLNVMASSSWISSLISDGLQPHGLTPAQYNVLRILRGKHPESHTCSAIGSRLIDRTPDVTRLLIRLESRDLISRRRADHDRRVVEVRITDEGLALLATVEEPMSRAYEIATEHLSEEEMEQLCDLLERFRTNQR